MKRNAGRILIFALIMILLLPLLALGETSLNHDQKELREDKEEKVIVETASEDEEESQVMEEKEDIPEEVEEPEEDERESPPKGRLPKIHFGKGGYRSKDGNQVTMIELKHRAPWCFIHVWDRTLDPITGATGYMSYFVLKDGDYAFCLNPTLPGPEGYLKKLFFPESSFRKKAEKIATVALSSGGFPGYSFDENFVFAQMYIWQSIPLSDGSPHYKLSFRNDRNWVEINEKITRRYNQWKKEIDQQIARLGKPSFHGESILLEVGEEITLTDTNAVLDQLNLRNQIDGLSVRKNGNQLILKATKAFSKSTLDLSYAKADYAFPKETYILQGHDDTYQDLGAFSDPYASFLQIEAKETKGKIKIHKKDEKKRSIEGAVFELAKDETFSQILETLKTDKNGEAISKDYSTTDHAVVYLREKSVPEPYILNPEIKKISLEAGKTKEVVVVNRSKKVLLKKTDAKTGEAVAGATISLINKMGVVKEYTTDEKGEILIEDLPAGDYVFYEIQSPPGYVRSQIEHKFTLSSNGSVQGRVHWENKKTEVILKKRDSLTHKALAGVELTLIDESGEEKSFITNDHGEIKLLGLHKGNYEITEAIAHPGYLPLKKNLSFTIDQDGLPSGDTVIFNEPTKVLLKKKSSDGKELGNVGFKLYPLDKEEALTFTFSEELGAYLLDDEGEEEIYTDKKGKILIYGLHPGEYKVQETSPLPGFLPLEEDPIFTLSEKGEFNGQKEITNEFTCLLLRKIGDQKKALADVGFKLYPLEKEHKGKALCFSYDKKANAYCLDEKGKEELRTNKKGEIKILGLALGNYVLEETDVPKGYLKADALTFTLSDKHGEKTPLFLEIRNRLEEVEEKTLPETGENRASILILILFFGTLGIFLLKRRVKH